MDLDEEIAKKVLPLAAKLGKAMMQGLKCDGFNVVQNNGEAAGQTVMHFHTHVIPRYKNKPAIVVWEPGKDEDMDNTVKLIKENFEN
ncbi:hypothetical protein P261_01351 [Lachnospiraceae bacterium TWA4]|nr:hypothetical protein P261_01351 [Lachnospiraceae bacterium TWA4]